MLELEISLIEPIERNSKREVQDYVVIEVCEVEPKGSQYRVKWESYDNKKRSDVMKLESVLNSSQLITEYLLLASGTTRMNAIKKMFHAAASVKTQKSIIVSSFSYKSWAEKMKNHTLPHTQAHTSRGIITATTIRLQNARQFKSTPEK